MKRAPGTIASVAALLLLLALPPLLLSGDQVSDSATDAWFYRHGMSRGVNDIAELAKLFTERQYEWLAIALPGTDLWERVHREITGQGLKNYQDIVDAARRIRGF